MCSETRTLKKKLKEAGFQLIRQGKHEVWSDGERKIIIPRGKSNGRTMKSVYQQLEERGPFHRKNEANKKEAVGE